MTINSYAKKWPVVRWPDRPD